MNNQEMMQMMMTMMSSAGNQSMTENVEILPWRAVLRPAAGKETLPFGVEKYTWGAAGDEFFLFDVNSRTMDLGELESRKNTASFFFNQPQGAMIKKDIEGKFGQIIKPESGETVTQLSGNVVSLPLAKGGQIQYDIHSLNKDGTPMIGKGGLPMVTRNATHESTFLTANQIKHMAETINRFQNRVAANTGATKRYRLVVESQAEGAVPPETPMIQ